MVKPSDLLSDLASFQLDQGLFPDSRAEVDELELDGIRVPRITNELWTARQRQGHSLHELSYRACFKAELPRFFIERLTAPGDVVFDPFMGRGTTLLEAALCGRVPAGNDVNPLARILIEPRLEPPQESEIAVRLDEVFEQLADPGPEDGEPDLSVFYGERTLGQIRGLRRWFRERDAAGRLNPADRWLRMVATNRLTGHSSGFLSGRTMPPNQAVSVATQRKLNERLGLTPPERDVRAVLLKKSRTLLRDPVDRAMLARLRDRTCLLTGDAAALTGIPGESVRCTITSPPFLDVIDYAKDNWLRCWFNGLDVDAIAPRVTTSRKLEDWSSFLVGVFSELFRITEVGGWVVFEVGEVRGGALKLEESVLPIACAAGFEAVGVAVHQQEFTKTANCWGVTNNRKGTNTNRLVLLRKERARCDA